MGKVIYIEGTQDLDNGDLRRAFAKLLEKELKGNMPRIVMGNGKLQTIDKFQTTPLKPDEERFLLIDSDIFIEDKSDICQSFNNDKSNIKLKSAVENTFFMIQEAESWILSQPDVLKKHKVEVKKLPQKNVMLIAKPSEVMSSLYKDSGREYHKVRDFCRLFPELDTRTLKVYYSEFKELIEVIRK